MVKALQLEDCMMLDGKSILDWKNPNALVSQAVLEKKNAKWTSTLGDMKNETRSCGLCFMLPYV